MELKPPNQDPANFESFTYLKPTDMMDDKDKAEDKSLGQGESLAQNGAGQDGGGERIELQGMCTAAAMFALSLWRIAAF